MKRQVNSHRIDPEVVLNLENVTKNIMIFYKQFSTFNRRILSKSKNVFTNTKIFHFPIFDISTDVINCDAIASHLLLSMFTQFEQVFNQALINNFLLAETERTTKRNSIFHSITFLPS